MNLTQVIRHWKCTRCGEVNGHLKPNRKRPEAMTRCPNCGARRERRTV